MQTSKNWFAEAKGGTTIETSRSMLKKQFVGGPRINNTDRLLKTYHNKASIKIVNHGTPLQFEMC